MASSFKAELDKLRSRFEENKDVAKPGSGEVPKDIPHAFVVNYTRDLAYELTLQESLIKELNDTLLNKLDSSPEELILLESLRSTMHEWNVIVRTNIMKNLDFLEYGTAQEEREQRVDELESLGIEGVTVIKKVLQDEIDNLDKKLQAIGRLMQDTTTWATVQEVVRKPPGQLGPRKLRLKTKQGKEDNAK